MSEHGLITTALASLSAALATPTGIIALISAGIAGVLVVVSYLVKTMIPLRFLAVGGNVGFLVYGALHPSLVMVLLHGALLPINLYRAAEMIRLTRCVREAKTAGDTSGVWLKPYMRAQRLRAGKELFHKGDVAEHLYFLAEGRIEFVEIGETMDAGRLFGEIAFFAPDRRRSLTARCVTNCTVLRIDENTFQQIYFQNPEFGFHVVSLITGRLLADRYRLEHQLEETRAASTVAPSA